MRKIIVFFSLIFVNLLFSPTISFAETENNIGFTIQAVIPENQVDKEQSYFDLRMSPSQEQIIYVQVINSSSEDIVFKLSVNQAYTNSAGFIDYADPDIEKDESLKYDISDIASYDSKVEVKANSSVSVPITLKMPSETFDGVIMSGIQVIKESSQSSEGISNKYGYVLGLILRETDNEIKRELNLISVKPAVSFSKTSVVARLQNPTMDAYGHLKYEAIVTNKKTGEVEREVSYDNNMQMAPNSFYDFAIDWNNEALVAGEYTLDLVVSDAKENVWEFSEDFIITKKEAKEINKVTVDKLAEKDNISIYVIALGAVLVLAIVILTIIIVKKRKNS